MAPSLLVIIPARIALSDCPSLQQDDSKYQGVFRVPQGTFGSSILSDSGTSLAYNRARNLLYVLGHDWDQDTAEISIPQVVNSTNLNSLAAATRL